MSKLTESFERFDSKQNKYLKLLSDITEFELLNKDNEILKKYKQLLKKKEDIENSIKEDKDVLYAEMLEEDTDLLEGKYINVSLKRPYYKTKFDTAKFIKDYPEGSRMYNKYVEKTLVKCNVIVKDPQKA